MSNNGFARTLRGFQIDGLGRGDKQLRRADFQAQAEVAGTKRVFGGVQTALLFNGPPKAQIPILVGAEPSAAAQMNRWHRLIGPHGDGLTVFAEVESPVELRVGVMGRMIRTWRHKRAHLQLAGGAAFQFVTRDGGVAVGHHPHRLLDDDFAAIGGHAIRPTRQRVEREFAEKLVAARRDGIGPKVGAQVGRLAVTMHGLFEFGDQNAAVLRAVDSGAQKRVIAARDGARHAAAGESAAAVGGDPFVTKVGRRCPGGEHQSIVLQI